MCIHGGITLPAELEGPTTTSDAATREELPAPATSAPPPTVATSMPAPASAAAAAPAPTRAPASQPAQQQQQQQQVAVSGPQPSSGPPLQQAGSSAPAEADNSTTGARAPGAAQPEQGGAIPIVAPHPVLQRSHLAASFVSSAPSHPGSDVDDSGAITHNTAAAADLAVKATSAPTSTTDVPNMATRPAGAEASHQLAQSQVRDGGNVLAVATSLGPDTPTAGVEAASASSRQAPPPAPVPPVASAAMQTATSDAADNVAAASAATAAATAVLSQVSLLSKAPSRLWINTSSSQQAPAVLPLFLPKSTSSTGKLCSTGMVTVHTHPSVSKLSLLADLWQPQAEITMMAGCAQTTEAANAHSGELDASGREAPSEQGASDSAAAAAAAAATAAAALGQLAAALTTQFQVSTAQYLGVLRAHSVLLQCWQEAVRPRYDQIWTLLCKPI